MTLEEARIVARIVGTADRGCPTCVSKLVKKLYDAFPDFAWEMGEVLREVIPDDDWDTTESYVSVVVLPRSSPGDEPEEGDAGMNPWMKIISLMGG